MESEHTLNAAADRARGRAAAATADEEFRSRLERELAESYRLASVILGDVNEAEDATHDAVERAWRARRQLRDPDRFGAWFQRILVNGCRDRLRRRRSGPKFIALSADGRERQGSDIAIQATGQDALGAALDRLDPDRRIVVVLRFFVDLEIAEIARRVGARPGTVKSRLHRALADLREVWEYER